ERIQQLQREEEELQRQLNAVAGQKQTLQSVIKSIDLSRQQTGTQISLTQNRISSTNLKLEELSYDIKDTEELIALDQRTLARSIRTMAEAGDISLVEQVFASGDLTELW